ncbi:type IX secretion system outer membrane channel protein PorV [Lewinella sp. IMCC34183]|uniref:type IX secretion system outer membrane channel protein PorV n=1 Tax=Lewinella sp. IMCC34183 TaxID=2248762 RepID=UPI0013008A93|nr:type IX secretion system outer membrane channel protein PorV [Lewinella sp. IMCC34183]
MKQLLSTLLCLAFVCATGPSAYAQIGACVQGPNGAMQPGTGGPCVNTVVSAVPFLRIAPDARGAAMGDAGVALSPDANAMHYNASRLAFSEEDLALSATYTPWLQALGLNDVYLAYVSGFKKLDENQALGVSLRYFSLGDIQYTDENNTSLGTGKPNEFEIAASYARRLTPNLGLSITGKYINSNLASGQQVQGQIIEAGQAVAADIGVNYRSEPIGPSGNILSIGGAITNVGNKIAYTLDTIRDFLPANLAVGAAYTFNLDQYNQITITAETNKLLVPTPCNGTANCPRTQSQIDDLSPISGILTSFSDAPDGFDEELREFTFSVGAEYWYAQQFAVRAGYFHEDQTKGGRRYLTTGLGLKYNIFGINLSYLVPTSNQRNPLDNTLRFSLLFDFGADVQP